MKAAFESLGYRTVFNQKVFHVFKAGDILKSEDELETAFNNGVRLLKILKLAV